ncbi:aminoglycoside phosphotransferase (APT) family kinase protein [Actinoplanes octamycinicus]|uniref:Aminoglycoside phosphotransferase (APT) family kinase protein n=2 Tax=Actinoplanes octamycinicus TaxID=135948 RepID=A0A7W7M7X9_9ACTN|nr:aminoglycoside phosphotransferase (APT) family kinase protein [Actinoplanes octamycinicus]
MKMHPDQVDISAGTVAALVASQFPEWRALPIVPVPSDGTVNALFRLGDDIVLRFPLRPAAGEERRQELADEQENARRVRRHVPLPVPEPLGLGRPGPGYPGFWSLSRWIPGRTVTPREMGDPDVFAADLAGFVTAVHAIDTEGRVWNGRSRGGPLHLADAEVRQALRASGRLTDTGRLARIWDECRDAPAGAGPGVWLHGDLMPGNLLVRDGRLAAVIDLGAMAVGDPAVDLMPAWNLLPASARETYRRALAVDDATWQRGRGWALVQAIMALPYYVDTNPAMAATARHTLDALLA